MITAVNARLHADKIYLILSELNKEIKEAEEAGLNISCYIQDAMSMKQSTEPPFRAAFCVGKTTDFALMSILIRKQPRKEPE